MVGIGSPVARWSNIAVCGVGIAVFALGCQGLFEDVDDLERPGGPDGETLEVEIVSGPVARTGAVRAEFEIQCNRENGCQFYCSLDGEGEESCESVVVYEDLSEGEHNFSVWAIDDYGNESEPLHWEWIVDTSPPEVIDFSGPEGITNERDAVFSFDCTKDDCRFYCDLQSDGGGAPSAPAGLCESGQRYLNLSDDRYHFSVYAVDDGEHQSEVVSLSWIVDTVIPEIAITNAPEVESWSDTATLEFECTNKEYCAFECAFDWTPEGGATEVGDWSECGSPVHVDNLRLGAHEFRLRATDRAGNQASASHFMGLSFLTMGGARQWR